VTNFEDKYFEKVSFSQESINILFEGALRDLTIAKEVNFKEVRFTYSYQALLKLGIAILAQQGGVRIKSTMGHHVKIIEKMSSILDDEEIFLYGNEMRMRRNADLYTGAKGINENEANDYHAFVLDIFKKTIAKLNLPFQI
jgi:hypothetical protein